MVQTTCCVVWLSAGRGVGIGPGGRGVTFHSFSFCLPLIAKLLFLREMQGATLNQYFCGAFINYGLKNTNLSSSACFIHLLHTLTASAACFFHFLDYQNIIKINKQMHKLPFKHYMWIRLIYAIWCGGKKRFCAKLLSITHFLFFIYKCQY